MLCEVAPNIDTLIMQGNLKKTKQKNNLNADISIYLT